MPAPARRNRDDDPFRDLFADFDREFRRMQAHLNDVFQQAMKDANAPDAPRGSGVPGNPFVYGFTMRLGPDGRPRVEQFGNVPHPFRPEAVVEGGREPITDLIDQGESLAVTVELPGAEKEDVQLFATDQQLTIKVDTAARKYYKELALPAPVRPDSTQATFKNGVLDVTLQKQRREPPSTGHRVGVK
jgi:HSP20 family protein